MDIGDTLAPDSDQLDAIDLVAGPRVFTITDVKRGSDEQPVQISLAEFPRVWRPGKSMRRVLVAAWGPDAAAYTGRRVELFCDPEVSFGKDKVGGTRIKRLSHIEKSMTVPLLVSRGRSAMYRVEPLKEEAAPTEAEWAERIAASTSIDQLRSWWQIASVKMRPIIEERVAALQAEAGGE